MAAINAEQGKAMLQSGKGSDFVIECQGRTWHVHKVVLASASEHFAVLCTGQFKV
jgi:hypothetical protein